VVQNDAGTATDQRQQFMDNAFLLKRHDDSAIHWSNLTFVQILIVSLELDKAGVIVTAT